MENKMVTVDVDVYEDVIIWCLIEAGIAKTYKDAEEIVDNATETEHKESDAEAVEKIIEAVRLLESGDIAI